MVRSNLSVHEACIHDLHSLLERLNFALEKILDEDFTLLLTDLHIFFPARVEQVMASGVIPSPDEKIELYRMREDFLWSDLDR